MIKQSIRKIQQSSKYIKQKLKEIKGKIKQATKQVLNKKKILLKIVYLTISEYKMWCNSGPATYLYKQLQQNTATLIGLGIACGCLCATAEEVSSCVRKHLAHKPQIFTVWPSEKKSLLILVINNCISALLKSLNLRSVP